MRGQLRTEMHEFLHIYTHIQLISVFSQAYILISEHFQNLLTNVLSRPVTNSPPSYCEAELTLVQYPSINRKQSYISLIYKGH